MSEIQPSVSNPYAAPQSEITGAGAVVTATDLTRQEVEAFVGKNYDDYWDHWRRATGPLKLMAGFSIAGFFFNLSWLLYRKMYGVFFLSAGLEVMFGYVVHWLQPAASSSLLTWITRVAFGVAVGLLGNGFYLRYARRAIGRARAQEPDVERRLAFLRKKGGVSVLAPIVALAVSFVVVRSILSR